MYKHFPLTLPCLLAVVLLVLTIHQPVFSAPPPQKNAQKNILTVSEGAVLLNAAPQYGADWASYTAFDGNDSHGWCSKSGATKNNEFLLELSQKYRLTGVAVDNRKCQEGSRYPGISSKTIQIWGSNTSAKDGFSKLATIQAGKGVRKEFPLSGDAQWLKLVVVDNWGNAEYTEMMELEVYGTAVTPVKEVSFTGVYETAYGCMKLNQKAGLISGCYSWNGNNLIFGAVQKRVFHAQWDQGAKDRGAAIFAMTEDGKNLAGVWYKDGELKGDWTGTRKNEPTCSCTDVLDPSKKMAQDLAEAGRSVLYGIHFQTDLAVIQPASEPTLQAVASLMSQQPALKIVVEGHTDQTNTEQYNQTLSEKRAAAVVAWLIQHGVAKDRMTAKGIGESKPIATNDSPQGRALNRRVEISKQ